MTEQVTKRFIYDSAEDIGEDAVQTFSDTIEVVARGTATTGLQIGDKIFRPKIDEAAEARIRAALERMARAIAEKAFAAGELHERLNGGKK